MVDILGGVPEADRPVAARGIRECAELALRHGLFIEWLACFVAAWEESKDPMIAASAGVIEWDM